MSVQQATNPGQLASIVYLFMQHTENIFIKAGEKRFQCAKLIFALFVAPLFVITLRPILKAVHRTSLRSLPPKGGLARITSKRILFLPIADILG